MYTIKAMYFGVNTFPQYEDNFDGQIMLERVSRAKVLTCDSKNQHFTEDVYINEYIKKGEWRQLIVESMTVKNSKVQVHNNYSLDGFVAERLHFHMKLIPVVEIKMLLFLNKMVISVRILNSKILM